MKLKDPRTWFKQDKQEAAYLTKIIVVTNCVKCPHADTPATETGSATGVCCGVTGDGIDNPAVRPSWCPLPTSLPIPDPAVIWEGEVVREE